MIKQFLILTLFLILLIGFTFGHYISCDRKSPEEKIAAVSELTKMTSPSLSVAYYEPRLLILDKAVNPSYPDMPAIDRTDFIYEK
jgi:hypothetical protein